MKKLLLILVLAGLVYWGWRQSRRITQTVDDGALTAQVTAQIAKTHPLALLSVKASAHRGIVDLRGHVKTAREEDELLESIRKIKGVAGIDNRLALDERLRTQGEIKKDLELTALIKENLVREEGLRGIQIHVAVTQGRVRLSGEVPSPEQARLAFEIARAVRGVKSVRNEIKVGKTGG